MGIKLGIYVMICSRICCKELLKDTYKNEMQLTKLFKALHVCCFVFTKSVNFQVINQKEPTAKGIHNDVKLKHMLLDL